MIAEVLVIVVFMYLGIFKTGGESTREFRERLERGEFEERRRDENNS